MGLNSGQLFSGYGFQFDILAVFLYVFQQRNSLLMICNASAFHVLPVKCVAACSFQCRRHGLVLGAYIFWQLDALGLCQKLQLSQGCCVVVYHLLGELFDCVILGFFQCHLAGFNFGNVAMRQVGHELAVAL